MIYASGTAPLFKFDVLKLAKQLLDEIERFRAYRDLSDEEKSGKTSRTPDESRVNTFFRLIGFPSIVSIKAINDKVNVVGGGKETDATAMTPGFKLGYSIGGATIKDTNKQSLKVEGSSVDGKPEQTVMRTLSERESRLKKKEEQNGSPSSNTDRIFAFKKPLPPRMDFSGSYQGRKDVFKRLSPFLTSYRMVYPGIRELARPFLQDAKKGFLINDELKRPFLETVVLIRMVSTTGGSDKTSSNYITQLRKSLDDWAKEANADKKELENMVKLLPENGDLLEAFIIGQMLMSVSQLARRWVALTKRVDEMLQTTEVAFAPKTAAARQNPLGKQSNESSVLQTKNASDDKRIKELEARIRKSEAIIGLLPIQDSVAKSTNGSAQAFARNVMSNALTTPFISVLRQDVDQDKKELESLKKQRIERSQKADVLRLELEMMTGEFSGISVPDVVFTIIALFLIEKRDLISLFDAETINEMKEDKVLKSALEGVGVGSPSPDAVLGATKKIRGKVKDLYALFNMEVQLAKDKSRRTLSPDRNKAGLASQAKSNKVDRTVDIGSA